MSKISKTVTENSKVHSKKVTNFMSGTSYTVTPLDTLKMIAASSIFGEPSYYRGSSLSRKPSYGYAYSYTGRSSWRGFEGLLVAPELDSKTTEDAFLTALKAALDYDFKATLDFAVELREDYLMRLNPQVILVEAAKHPSRVDFNKTNPGYFRDVQKRVMSRGDEPAMQFSYWLYSSDNSKKGLPSCLKRAWADKLSSMSDYTLNKYKNAEESIIDTVRVSHATSEGISKLLKGELEVKTSEKTWNALKSEGRNWYEITSTIRVPYMALLRNLRGISLDFAELQASGKVSFKDLDARMTELTARVTAEVLTSKQFPFRFHSALTALEEASGTGTLFQKDKVTQAIKTAMNLSLDNLPRVSGKTAVLSDNSGSAWGTLNSEYGTVKVAEIGNLSAVLTAMNSDEGYVYTFGDRLIEIPVTPGDVLENTKKVNQIGQGIGMSTETGLFEFFRKAINNSEHWDNIFIYSDMQAGARGCYDKNDYRDLQKLVKEYRKKVNKKVNIFSVQTAGYNNTVLPAYLERQTLLYGWTGKELVFAKAMNEFWDKAEAQSEQ